MFSCLGLTVAEGVKSDAFPWFVAVLGAPSIPLLYFQHRLLVQKFLLSIKLAGSGTPGRHMWLARYVRETQLPPAENVCRDALRE